MFFYIFYNYYMDTNPLFILFLPTSKGSLTRAPIQGFRHRAPAHGPSKVLQHRPQYSPPAQCTHHRAPSTGNSTVFQHRTAVHSSSTGPHHRAQAQGSSEGLQQRAPKTGSQHMTGPPAQGSQHRTPSTMLHYRGTVQGSSTGPQQRAPAT